ncbi:MAG: hypothetical protein ABI921_15480, partial [Panacibacter sp.]
MKILLVVLLFLSKVLHAQKQVASVNKNAVLASVEKHKQELINLSDSIWSYAELAMKETRSSKILADYA